MRIALILPGFSQHPDDWAIPALLNLACGLAKTHDIHIFSQRYPAGGFYQFNGLSHHALGGGQRFGLTSLKIWLQTTRMIVAQHRKAPFDLLHAFWVDEAGFSAALAGSYLGRPVLASIGGGELINLPTLAYGARRFLVRRLTSNLALARATIVTAGSSYQLELCRAYDIPSEKLRYAPLGVDTGRFSPSETDPIPARPALIQAASLVPVKNQAMLLQTVRLVRQRIPNITLHLAGTGPEQPRLVKLAQRLDLSQNITWHGQVSYPDMPRLYRQAHLYLQSSLHESQGLSVLEAMACGLPVLGTPVGVVKTVACLPPRIVPDLLADQIIELLADSRPYRRQCSHQARQQVVEQFSLPVTLNNFNQLYAEAVSLF